MSSKAIEYLKDELLKLKTEYVSLEKDIQSIDIEIETIEKNIKKLDKSKDHTGDILHSISMVDSSDFDRKDVLNTTKEELVGNRELLILNKNEAYEKILAIEQVLQSPSEEPDDDVSCETFEQDNLENTFIYMNELDRERISRDIHDTVVQNLTALIHKQEFINQLFDNDPTRSKLEIKNTINILKETIEELRDIIFDLRPMALDDLGFKTALLDLISNVSNDLDNIIVEYNVIGDNDNVNQTISISIIRILRELISNSVKHSNCTKISIEINLAQSITLLYKDNGCGFDFNKNYYNKETKSGFGTQILKERVKLLNGTIEYNNDNGSIFSIVIPT